MKIALVCTDTTSGDPPLGIGYIASYLRQYGGFNDIVIVDKENLLKRIEKEKPDLVGISAMTPEFPRANLLAKKIKNKFDIPIIIGGHHITYLPQHLALSNFDIGVLGEGEKTMLELVSYIDKHGLDLEGMSNINGIVTRKGINAPRDFIEPMDSIPFPARDLLKMDYYLMPRRSIFDGKFGRHTSIISERGCIYKCRFCSSSYFWKRLRFFSAEYVVNEIKHLIENYKIEGLMFYDDLFISNKKRVKEIAELIKKEKINEQIEFGVLARANLIDDEILNVLKNMNVTLLSYGFESGSEKILNWLKMGSVTVEDNYRAMRMSKKYGFRTMSGFIIGSPDETKEDILQTLKLMEDKDMDEPLVGQLTPYPNTPIWDIAKNMGIVSEDIDFDYSKLSLGGFRPEVLMNRKMSVEEFEKLYNILNSVAMKKDYSRVKISRRLLSPKIIKKALINWRASIELMKNSIR